METINRITSRGHNWFKMLNRLFTFIGYFVTAIIFMMINIMLKYDYALNVGKQLFFFGKAELISQ